ncbi:hypothetical protein [Pseudomonas aeruginosa]|uniref:hypothetical protein n=1 Tax=Pseudomonas aeruginosa TaxID=287 RepID=UPI002155CD04|nr:hypothetical protein [Pseudomonas aeruginosa]
MAIHINDKLQRTFRGLNADSRFTTWLWFFIKFHSPQAYLGEFRSPGMRDRMAEVINQDPHRADFIEAQSAISLLPAQSLQWITNDKRQNIFLIRKLAEKNGNNYLVSSANLTGRDLTIATIDTWQTDQTQKSALVSQIKWEWELHTSSDHMFKWFDDADEREKLNTAWEIAKNKYSSLLFQQTPFQEKNDFIIFFDSQFLTASDKTLLMESIKKRWSQNKYRAKMTGKKQYNFILSDKTIKRLDNLADKHNLKRTQVLDILLQMEEEKGIYIPERLKPLIDS